MKNSYDQSYIEADCERENAAYLFIEKDGGYKGKRQFLTKIKEVSGQQPDFRNTASYLTKQGICQG